MPLMCCDACSEIDFKPVSLGACHTYVCKACKQVSTHTPIAQSSSYSAKKINPEELIFNHEVLPVVEAFYGEQFSYTFDDEYTDHFSTVTYTGKVALQIVAENLLTPNTELNQLLMNDQQNRPS